jgi:chromosome segregation ATPase
VIPNEALGRGFMSVLDQASQSQLEIAALRAEVERLQADRARLVAERDELIRQRDEVRHVRQEDVRRLFTELERRNTRSLKEQASVRPSATQGSEVLALRDRLSRVEEDLKRERENYRRLAQENNALREDLHRY